MQVVHLVRDPRAMLHSRGKLPGTWSSTDCNASTLCGHLEEDHRLADRLPRSRCRVPSYLWLSSRYLRVRYDDLVASPLAEVARVLRFLGQEVEQEHRTLLDSFRQGGRWQAYM